MSVPAATVPCGGKMVRREVTRAHTDTPQYKETDDYKRPVGVHKAPSLSYLSTFGSSNHSNGSWTEMGTEQ